MGKAVKSAESSSKSSTFIPIFDTMAQCSAVMGIPIDALKAAKAAGCPAFKTGSRVDVRMFCEWFFNKGQDVAEVSDWGKKKEEYQAKREKIKLSKDERAVVPRDFIQQENQTALAMMFGELDRAFGSELPARFKGLNEAEIRGLAVIEVEQIKKNLREKFDRAAEGQDA